LTSKKVIFIADTDDNTLTTLKNALNNKTYNFESSRDGHEALKKIKKLKPDIVIVELLLPRMHGFSICQKIKSNKNTKRIPVIMISAKAYPVDIQKAKTFGADLFLVKPYKISDLVKNVKKFLDKRKSRCI